MNWYESTMMMTTTIATTTSTLPSSYYCGKLDELNILSLSFNRPRERMNEWMNDEKKRTHRVNGRSRNAISWTEQRKFDRPIHCIINFPFVRIFPIRLCAMTAIIYLSALLSWLLLCSIWLVYHSHSKGIRLMWVCQPPSNQITHSYVYLSINVTLLFYFILIFFMMWFVITCCVYSNTFFFSSFYSFHSVFFQRDEKCRAIFIIEQNIVGMWVCPSDYYISRSNWFDSEQ